MKLVLMNNRLLKQIERFCVVGGVAFLIDAGVLYILREWFSVYYLIANTISFTVSTIYNFLASTQWVFEATEEKKKNKTYTILFVLFSVVGLGLNQMCMYLFVSKIGIYYMIAKILSTGIVMCFNFVTRKKMYG